MNKAICPKCSKPISRVPVEYVEIQGPKVAYKGVSYICPSCHCVLSIQMDPISLNADLLKRQGRQRKVRKD
jgi:hypothetical protein